MQLEKSQKFKKELHTYKTAMAEIDDQKQQQDLRILIERLIDEVKLIDKMHNDLHITNAIPETINSNRLKIVSIRKDIQKIIKDNKIPR